jgi:hypothetical protein
VLYESKFCSIVTELCAGSIPDGRINTPSFAAGALGGVVGDEVHQSGRVCHGLSACTCTGRMFDMVDRKVGSCSGAAPSELFATSDVLHTHNHDDARCACPVCCGGRQRVGLRDGAWRLFPKL